MALRKCLAIAGVVVWTSVSVAAQGRPGRGGGAPGAPGAVEQGISPGEVQRMFDAYALMQAQDQLKIDDAQFARFLTRYKALQDTRRKTLQERGRLVMELRRMVNTPEPDDAQLKDRMTALQDLDLRSAADLKKAYDAIDQVLDVRQQAKFRVFEELMERRKLDLVTRARQSNRPRNQQ